MESESFPLHFSIFRHESLPENSTYIRLLEVLDVNHSAKAKVRCKLTTWPVKQAPLYHAISYTWGDPVPTETIIVNNRRMEVRQNCEYVLKQAHWHGGSRYHWVDAICIDQNNLVEKGNQVAMMGNIFRRAARVLACVGRHADDSGFLYETLATHQRAWNCVDTYSEPRIWKWRTRATVPVLRTRLGLRTSETRRRLLLALKEFSQRPYFSRLWVFQELYHGSKVSFLCGKDHLPSRLLYGLFKSRHWPALWCPYSITEFFQGTEANLDPTRLPTTEKLLEVASQPPTTRVPLFILSVIVLDLFCEDPRDRLYGIISIVDWDSLGITPIIADYTKKEFEVVVGFFRKLAESQVNINSHATLSISMYTGSNIVHNLALTATSDGLYDAIKARQDCPEEEQHTPRNMKRPLVRVKQACCRGRRILQEEIDGSFRALFLNSSRINDGIDVLLPRQTRAGDWLLSIFPYLGLVAREQFPGKYAIIGKSIIVKRAWETLSACRERFDVFLDVEDTVVLLGTRPDFATFDFGNALRCREYLETRVCGNSDSSYAIRVVQKSRSWGVFGNG